MPVAATSTFHWLVVIWHDGVMFVNVSYVRPMQWECLNFMSCTRSFFLKCRRCVCRVEDYWEGYKFFCYAYYSHSIPHMAHFRETKLGSLFHSANWFLAYVVQWYCVLNFFAYVFYWVQRFLGENKGVVDALAQVNWYGAVMHNSLLLRTRLCAIVACNCSLLWRCIASGN